MADDRARRAAITEAAFRIANDRMAAWEDASATEPELFFCECMMLGCREKVALTRVEYEAVRAEPRHFFAVDGHQEEQLETVIERHDGWLVIEKPPELDPVVKSTDPRASEGPSGPDADAARELADEIGNGGA
jgi:hypothetical protein